MQIILAYIYIKEWTLSSSEIHGILCAVHSVSLVSLFFAMDDQSITLTDTLKRAGTLMKATLPGHRNTTTQTTGPYRCIILYFA